MRDHSCDMTIEDFVFMSFMRGATLINKRLRDKRLKSNKYVADRRFMADLDPKYEESARDDVVCWFHVPIGTKHSISLERWAQDCEKMGLNWEIRQHDEKHWTVFLFLRNDWIYNRQIRSFGTVHRQYHMSIEDIMKESIGNINE